MQYFDTLPNNLELTSCNFVTHNAQNNGTWPRTFCEQNSVKSHNHLLHCNISGKNVIQFRNKKQRQNFVRNKHWVLRRFSFPEEPQGVGDSCVILAPCFFRKQCEGGVCALEWGATLQESGLNLFTSVKDTLWITVNHQPPRQATLGRTPDSQQPGLGSDPSVFRGEGEQKCEGRGRSCPRVFLSAVWEVAASASPQWFQTQSDEQQQSKPTSPILEILWFF